MTNTELHIGMKHNKKLLPLTLNEYIECYNVKKINCINLYIFILYNLIPKFLQFIFLNIQCLFNGNSFLLYYNI